MLAQKRKKPDLKDWYIFEHCLAVARELVAAGFPPHAIFVTSNITDFSDPTSRLVPNPDLRPEFDAAGLGYAVSLEAALAKLRGAKQLP